MEDFNKFIPVIIGLLTFVLGIGVMWAKNKRDLRKTENDITREEIAFKEELREKVNNLMNEISDLQNKFLQVNLDLTRANSEILILQLKEAENEKIIISQKQEIEKLKKRLSQFETN